MPISKLILGKGNELKNAAPSGFQSLIARIINV